MFTQPCFIRKDTPELRNKLKDLGQIENIFDDFSGGWLAANHGMFISVCEGFQNLCKEDIDCGTNEALFLAISALRNDTDKNQIFVLDSDMPRWNNPSFIQHKKGTFIKCIRDKWNIDEVYPQYSSRNFPAHKATVEELIEHFKNIL